MIVKVWYCFGNQCLTPCIFPYDKGHDAPDDCAWGGLSYFKYKEIDVNELLKYYVPDCKHLNFQQVCSLRKGICPSDINGLEEGCREKERIERSLQQ